MSKLGRIFYREGNDSAFLAGSGMPDLDRGFSEQTAREIDLEVRRLIDQGEHGL